MTSSATGTPPSCGATISAAAGRTACCRKPGGIYWVERSVGGGREQDFLVHRRDERGDMAAIGEQNSAKIGAHGADEADAVRLHVAQEQMAVAGSADRPIDQGLLAAGLHERGVNDHVGA